MKRIVFFILINCWPALAFGQVVNPDTIQQAGDIYLQNTDVYYCPFAPPDSLDTRANLCNESDLLNDPNGVGNQWRDYLPKVGDTAVWHDTMLYRAHPCGPGRVLGGNVCWQRLFQARSKPDGSPSDLIAGSNVVTPDTTYDTLGLDGYLWVDRIITNPSGPVIVSANEDVDFRASGRIKLKSGFHVKPGAFFHAYTDPKWDTTVFSDEFDSATKFHNQWFISNGEGGPTGTGNNFGQGYECLNDSNVYLDTDYQAHDGHALDIALRIITDTCSCYQQVYDVDSCFPKLDTLQRQKTAFSTGFIRTCPFPFAYTGSTLGPSAYAHAPYGKYEFRDKIPHTIHHTNNWGGGDGEYDLNETTNLTMGVVHPNWSHNYRYGPYNGIFKSHGLDTFFLSPDAGWCSYNIPLRIIINNFEYEVDFDGRVKDTVIARPGSNPALQGGFPISLATDTTDSVSFYYERYNQNTSDSVTWTIDSTGRMLSAPYQEIGGTKYFSKNYQPTSITLRDSINISGDTIKDTYPCRWDATLDTILLVNTDGSPVVIPSSHLHTNTEHFQYTVTENGGYPVPTVMIDADTTNPANPGDSANYVASPYRYHTFTMEWLPHEVRFLYDSVVVRRFPDRLVPRGNKYYDWVTTEPRIPASIYPAELDVDFGNSTDSLGVVPGSASYIERQYFMAHTSNPGFWPVYGQPAAHHLLDYVKVWDVPKDVIIPGYPH